MTPATAIWTTAKQIVVDYYSALTRGEFAALDRLTADSGPLNPNRPPGVIDSRQHARSLYGAFTDLLIAPTLLIEDNGYVLARAALSGTHTGDFGRFPASGQDIYLTSMELFRIDGGRIAEHRMVADTWGLLQQLGHAPGDGSVFARREGGLTIASAADAETTQANRDRLMPYLLANLSGQIDLVIEQYYGPYYLNHVESGEVITQTRDQMAEIFGQSFGAVLSAISDLQVPSSVILAEGNLVGIFNTFSAIHSGAFMGVPPSGQRIEVLNSDVWRMEGEKVVEHWGFMDQLTFLQRLGVIPSD